ncbi:putative extracellular ligand-binding protein [Aliarcobacter faecis]|uniref:ABC transporter substrate-binding protein n=1 Tax=Aliarcobacter faecis TaxID=1564138 RepID=UPI0004794E81|nr:ABC transporter substrate-binding protein [Aliarcobacter faecis]QKF72974.1 putative extracellular ligand-binding protein [Aliarcobacter faecis]
MLKKILPIILILCSLYFFLKEERYSQKEIKIASSMPLSGLMQPWGDAVLEATKSYFSYTNDNKLLENRKIEFIALDDKYEPDLTYENMEKLKQQKNIFSFFGMVGTPTIKRILPIIYDEDILFFSPFSGAEFLQDESLTTLINFRASYKQELENLISYLKKREIKNIAIFYQNDDFGEEGYLSSLEILKKENLNLVATGSYKRNTLSIEHAFSEIKHSKPEAIIMIGAYKANSFFIQKAKNDEILKDTIFCNISFSDANSIVNELKSTNTDKKNIIFSQVVPNYNDKNLKIVQEYQEIMQKYSPNSKLGFLSFESFLASKVLVDAIKRANHNLTKKEFIKALKNTPNNLLYEIKIKYHNKILLNQTYLFEYLDDSFKELK